MGVLMVLVMSLSARLYDMSVKSFEQTQEQLNTMRQQIDQNKERISLLEQLASYQQKQLDRIEDGINTLQKRR